MNILIFGVQGSGKSTVGKYIADNLNIPFVATGEVFRRLREENTSTGKMIKERYDRGVLAPDDLTMDVVNQRLAQKDAEKGFVLDGAPRNLTQVGILKKPVDLLILVKLDRNEALRRLLSRGRIDDNEEAIKKRWSWYEEQTKPVIGYYKEKRVKVITVDNTPPEEVVRKKLDDLLKEFKRN